MTEFIVGDKVRRTGGNYIDVMHGEILIIKKITNNGSLMFEDKCTSYDDRKFELVKNQLYAIY